MSFKCRNSRHRTDLSIHRAATSLFVPPFGELWHATRSKLSGYIGLNDILHLLTQSLYLVRTSWRSTAYVHFSKVLLIVASLKSAGGTRLQWVSLKVRGSLSVFEKNLEEKDQSKGDAQYSRCKYQKLVILLTTWIDFTLSSSIPDDHLWAHSMVEWAREQRTSETENSKSQIVK